MLVPFSVGEGLLMKRRLRVLFFTTFSAALLLLAVLFTSSSLLVPITDTHQINDPPQQAELLSQLMDLMWQGDYTFYTFAASGEPVPIPRIIVLAPPNERRNYFWIGLEERPTAEVINFILEYAGIPRAGAVFRQATSVIGTDLPESIFTKFGDIVPITLLLAGYLLIAWRITKTRFAKLTGHEAKS